MHLLAGLGNPGERYLRNRHNVGFLAIDAIASRFGYGPFRTRFSSLCANGTIDGHRVLLLKPQTFMNESGNAIGAAARYHKLAPRDVTILHDELDLSPGKLRVRSSGSLAGHRGLLSVRAHLGDGFRRVRIGVGRPPGEGKATSHVLGDFARADAAWLQPLLTRIAEHLPGLLAGDDSGFVGRVVIPDAPGDTEA